MKPRPHQVDPLYQRQSPDKKNPVAQMTKFAMNHGVLRGQHEGHIALAREVLIGNLEANAGFEITHTGEKSDIRGRNLNWGKS